MNTLLRKSIYALFAMFLLVAFSGCSEEQKHLRMAMNAAGKNKTELKAVLKHYKEIDPNPEKLAAARFLIENMMGHISYRTDSIKAYYEMALNVFDSDLSVDAQRDSLRKVCYNRFNKVTTSTIVDCRKITSEYLIHNIDHAYYQWKNRPWSKQLSFDEFCEWLLPYKEEEKQDFDDWRDKFSAYFSDSISKFTYTDDKESTVYHTIEIVRNEINNKVVPHIYWGSTSGLPFLSTETMLNTTFGSCKDYVTLGVLGFRSLGLPAVIDEVPEWGRNCDGHSWYVFLDDRGREQRTVNSLILGAGIQFYPYERIPKVWRNTYAINWDVVEYKKKSKYKHPFPVTSIDVTDKYNRTSDIAIPINKYYQGTKLKLDKYAYIAKFNGRYSDWSVLDFGRIKRGKAHFRNMGNNNMYIVLGYDGVSLKPISSPFVLTKDGSVRYIQVDVNNTRTVVLRRKYFSSYNDVVQRNKILGAQIQYSDKPDFSDCHTVLTIDSVNIPDKLAVKVASPHKYWRYLALDGTNGSIAELAFFDKDSILIEGTPICSTGDLESAKNAFDGNWLTNYETPWNKPDGAWVGLAFPEGKIPSYVRVVPRGDGNDIIPGDIYELKCFVDGEWTSLGISQAHDSYLCFDDVPNTLLWLSDLSGGIEERPFIIDKDNNIEWW